MPVIPPIEQLALFAEVVERGGFSAAAQSLGRSKGNISKSIAALEEALGVALLRRNTRSLSLTEAGERVLARARRIREEAQGALEDAGEQTGEVRGRLKVAAPLSFAQRWLTPILPQFLSQYPDLELDLSLQDRAQDIISEGFDLVLRISRMADSQLIARKIASIRSYVVASPQYWEQHGMPSHPRDLEGHVCLHYSMLSSGAQWRFLDSEGALISVRIDGRLCADNGDVLNTLATQGLGVVVSPDFMCAEEVRAGLLVPVLLDWPVPELTLHALTVSRQLPLKVRVFSDFLHRAFGSDPSPWSNLQCPESRSDGPGVRRLPESG